MPKPYSRPSTGATSISCARKGAAEPLLRRLPLAVAEQPVGAPILRAVLPAQAVAEDVPVASRRDEPQVLEPDAGRRIAAVDPVQRRELGEPPEELEAWVGEDPRR